MRYDSFAEYLILFFFPPVVIYINHVFRKERLTLFMWCHALLETVYLSYSQMKKRLSHVIMAKKLCPSRRGFPRIPWYPVPQKIIMQLNNFEEHAIFRVIKLLLFLPQIRKLQNIYWTVIHSLLFFFSFFFTN